jgi:Putative addiction module component
MKHNQAPTQRSLPVSLDGEELSPEWEETIARRVTELDSGSVVAIPADVVFLDLKQRFGST